MTALPERRGRAKVAVFIAGMAAFLDLYPTQAVLPELAQAFAAGPGDVALTVTAGTLAVALIAPIMGAIADRLGRKRLIVAACLALALPTLGVAQAASLTEVLIWRFVQGLCLPAIFAVTIAYIGEEWPRAEAAAITGLYIAGTILGGFLGRFLVALLTDWADWRTAFVGLAAINAGCGIGLAILLPASRHFTPASGWARAFSGIGRHVRNPRLLGTYAVGFGVLFSLVALFTYANFHLAGPPFSLGLAELGSVFAVYLLGVVTSPGAGWLARRLGRRGALAAAVGMTVLGGGLALGMTVPMIVLGLGCACIGLFIAQSSATGFVATEATEGRTAAVGLYVTCYYIGGSLGAVLPAPLWTVFGWPAVVGLVVIVQGVSLTAAFFAWRG